MGEGIRAAAMVVERLARECGSTAMVTCMHYAGTTVIEKHGPENVRRDIAGGRHLSTLAFSESGSRSHFWVPGSTAARARGGVQLDAHKSWITSASQATAYVWSSQPVSAEGLSTLWLVPRTTPGLEVQSPFDGLGLRGNDSSPVIAEKVIVPESNRLGSDGGGFDLMLGTVLPFFNVMSAGISIGFMEAAVARTAAHATSTRYEHLQQSIADQPTARHAIAGMRIKTDMARALWLDTLDAIESSRADAVLRVLECKAAASATALEVTATAMQVCGGSAYRKELGLERIFRDAQAATVMAPTTDQLHDFIGKAVCGLPVF
jgi:alkylation response protein AidB-like acyl-CoA dehydrogenase